MDDVAPSFVTGVERCFADVHDPRVQASCAHPLLGVACGAEDFTDLEWFGRQREASLRTFLELPGGIPSHDKFRRVLGVLQPEEFPHRSAWKDVKSLVVATSGRDVDGHESWESRDDITDRPPKARPLGQAIRKPWGIGNSQHWVLDVTFGEDARRQQDRHGTTNLAAVRRLIVSLLRQDKTVQQGAKAKRLACALDPDYLLTIFRNAQFDA